MRTVEAEWIKQVDMNFSLHHTLIFCCEVLNKRDFFQHCPGGRHKTGDANQHKNNPSYFDCFFCNTWTHQNVTDKKILIKPIVLYLKCSLKINYIKKSKENHVCTVLTSMMLHAKCSACTLFLTANTVGGVRRGEGTAIRKHSGSTGFPVGRFSRGPVGRCQGKSRTVEYERILKIFALNWPVPLRNATASLGS